MRKSIFTLSENFKTQDFHFSEHFSGNHYQEQKFGSFDIKSHLWEKGMEFWFNSLFIYSKI